MKKKRFKKKKNQFFNGVIFLKHSRAYTPPNFRVYAQLNALEKRFYKGIQKPNVVFSIFHYMRLNFFPNVYVDMVQGLH